MSDEIKNEGTPETLEHEENGGHITKVEIASEMKKRFLEYGMSVIVSRALPDVRDGLKPVHRRILYTMYENGLTPDEPYRKCADTVGAVLGRYHPHGDSSVYDAMVRMAQDFSLRYMLIDGHGNFGSIDGYGAAAYRYTEARMSKLSLHMLDDIDKETVNFVSNYDDRLKEPEVLPARFPQLLVNGSEGIAVGMATRIPPHNLGEVIDGMCCLIDNPDVTTEELCEHIKGPDFPTGGIIMGHSGIRAAYATGRGRIVLRAKTEIEEMKGGRHKIIVTEIPYMVNKLNLVKTINDLIDEKRVDGLEDIVDLSGRDGIRVEIIVKRDASPEVVLNHLFSFTQLQITYGVILLALVDGRPKILTLKEILENYIDYQCEIITRRTAFDLRKARERAHILEGYKIALDYIDEVIKIIRASKTVDEAKTALGERFGLDDIQTTAIVKMPLGRLSGMERQKIEEELAEKHAKIAELEGILADHAKVLDIVKTEALNLRDKFSDDRRTKITAVSGDVDIEDLIPVEDCILTKTSKGYIKRLPCDEYSAQNRGGKGIIGMTTRDDDNVESMFVCSSHDVVMLFSNLGRVYRLKAYEIPEGSRTSRGLNIVNILPLMQDEKITVMLPVPPFESENYVNMVTKKGIIKRTLISLYKHIRKTGVIAINLDDDDELAFVTVTGGEDQLLVATKKGMAIRFNEQGVRPLGRTARGVRVIRMKNGDEVVGMVKVDNSRQLLTITETGFGRCSSFDDYRIQSRGGKGLTNYRTAKFGDVAGILAVDGEMDVIMMASDGIIIRVAAEDISSFARPAKGVRVMKFKSDDAYVLQIASVMHDDDEEFETPDAPDAESAEAVDDEPETDDNDVDIEDSQQEESEASENKEAEQTEE